jgi:hypothetical protein
LEWLTSNSLSGLAEGFTKLGTTLDNNKISLSGITFAQLKKSSLTADELSSLTSDEETRSKLGKAARKLNKKGKSSILLLFLY